MRNWDASEKWYSFCIGERGHYYHQSVILPNAMRLLGKFSSLLDLGCGQGVLARRMPPKVEYVGIDQSKALVASAKKLTPKAQFFVGDVSKKLPIEKTNFDRTAFILSLQNMENGKEAILRASQHLISDGKLLIVLNHPCFRIPRQSSWGIDEAKKWQYRRVDSYMSHREIPIQIQPGKGEKSAVTYSYHHPLSEICSWLQKGQFRIEMLEEWCSDKKSTGTKSKMEDRSRKEFPLFLAILAVKAG